MVSLFNRHCSGREDINEVSLVQELEVGFCLQENGEKEAEWGRATWQRLLWLCSLRSKNEPLFEGWGFLWRPWSGEDKNAESGQQSVVNISKSEGEQYPLFRLMINSGNENI